MVNRILEKLFYIFCKINFKAIINIISQLHVLFTVDYENEISDNFYKCLIYAEDKRFYYHIGVDIIAIISAMKDFILYKKLRGASTIEQQLVRIITGKYEITLKRKLFEILFACYISNAISKKDILGIYLMVAHFGYKQYGLMDVCNKMNINIKNATLSESAEVIAKLKYPEYKSHSKRRANQILKRKEYIINQINKIEKAEVNIALGNLEVELKI